MHGRPIFRITGHYNIYLWLWYCIKYVLVLCVPNIYKPYYMIKKKHAQAIK